MSEIVEAYMRRRQRYDPYSVVRGSGESTICRWRGMSSLFPSLLPFPLPSSPPFPSLSVSFPILLQPFPLLPCWVPPLFNAIRSITPGKVWKLMMHSDRLVFSRLLRNLEEISGSNFHPFPF